MIEPEVPNEDGAGVLPQRALRDVRHGAQGYPGAVVLCSVAQPAVEVRG